MSDQATNFDYDVFLSYSAQDAAWVSQALLPRLEKAGLKTFIDFRDFEPGALVKRNIVEAWIAADVALTPTVGDLLLVGSQQWTAITITEYAPDGGLPIAWKAYLER